MPPAGADPNAAVATPYNIGAAGGGDEMAFLLRSLLKGRDRSLAQTPGETLGMPQAGMATTTPAMPSARPLLGRSLAGFGALKPTHKPSHTAKHAPGGKIGKF